MIISIDDFSRKILFADFVPADTTWAHIQAAQALMQTFGIPLRYYVDSLRVLRFVQGRDSFWRKHVLETDDVGTQWRKTMRVMGQVHSTTKEIPNIRFEKAKKAGNVRPE